MPDTINITKNTHFKHMVIFCYWSACNFYETCT